jgi:hypothetical protein
LEAFFCGFVIIVRIRDVVKIDKDPKESQMGSSGTVCCACADVDESLGSRQKPTRVSDQVITTRVDKLVESGSTNIVYNVNDLSRSLSMAR